MDPIDFVIAWVDGSDPEWQKDRDKYRGAAGESAPNLYRDWDNLHYWFRGVEKYAPWVNKIHFVTCGHLPDWLNTDHPQLNIVKHTDYMPAAYLPTFSSHAIELNLHRIAGLAEQFVYFNDDMFITGQVQPDDFFRNGLPCDSPVMSVLVPDVPKDPFFHYIVNALCIINHHFSRKEVLKKHWRKWFNLKYGKYLWRNLYYLPMRGFTGFYYFHLASPLLKSTLQEVWEKQPEILDATSRNKFRTLHDVSQLVFCWWQLASGKFCPRSPNWGRFFIAGENDAELFRAIASGKYQMICINDSVMEIDFEGEKQALNKEFDRLLPDKSKFEL